MTRLPDLTEPQPFTRHCLPEGLSCSSSTVNAPAVRWTRMPFLANIAGGIFSLVADCKWLPSTHQCSGTCLLSLLEQLNRHHSTKGTCDSNNGGMGAGGAKLFSISNSCSYWSHPIPINLKDMPHWSANETPLFFTVEDIAKNDLVPAPR